MRNYTESNRSNGGGMMLEAWEICERPEVTVAALAAFEEARDGLEGAVGEPFAMLAQRHNADSDEYRMLFKALYRKSNNEMVMRYELAEVVKHATGKAKFKMIAGLDDEYAVTSDNLTIN